MLANVDNYWSVYSMAVYNILFIGQNHELREYNKSLKKFDTGTQYVITILLHNIMYLLLYFTRACRR